VASDVMLLNGSSCISGGIDKRGLWTKQHLGAIFCDSEMACFTALRYWIIKTLGNGQLKCHLQFHLNFIPTRSCIIQLDMILSSPHIKEHAVLECCPPCHCHQSLTLQIVFTAIFCDLFMSVNLPSIAGPSLTAIEHQ
jgi:hypothetical protein